MRLVHHFHELFAFYSPLFRLHFHLTLVQIDPYFHNSLHTLQCRLDRVAALLSNQAADLQNENVLAGAGKKPGGH
jgi:hypothetical protein